MRAAARILGVVAFLLAFFLVVGLLLPGRWSAERTVEVRAPPKAIFPLLNAPSRWDDWTPWAELESSFEGPSSGAGASRAWNDRRYGRGRLTIVASEEPRRIRYRVEVEGGAIRIEGALILEPVPVGTRVVWTERGDFGWNPLLGWTALVMERSQGEAMDQSLARLKEAAEVEAER